MLDMKRPASGGGNILEFALLQFYVYFPPSIGTLLSHILMGH